MSTRTQAALLMDHPFPEPLIPDGISKEVDTADFGYDALGRRISRRVGDTEETFAYDAIGRVIEMLSVP